MRVTMSLVNYDSFALLNAILTEIEETGSSKKLCPVPIAFLYLY